MRYHSHLLSQMRDRGWKQGELDYAHHIMANGAMEKSRTRVILDESLFWFFLLFIGVGNLFIIASVLPMLVIFPNHAIYAVLLVLGLVIGVFTQIIVKDIEHLMAGHHLYGLYVIVPFIAISGGLLVITIAENNLPNILFLNRNPLKMSIIYTFSFMLPLIIYKITTWKNKINKH